MEYYAIEENGFIQVIGHEKDFAKEEFAELYNEAVQAVKDGYRGVVGAEALNSDKIVDYLCDVHNFDWSVPQFTIAFPEDVLGEVDLKNDGEVKFFDHT